MSSNSSQNLNNLIGFLAKKSLFKPQQLQKQKQKSIRANEQKHLSEVDPFSRSITPKNKKSSVSQIGELNVFRDCSQKQLIRRGVSMVENDQEKQFFSTVTKMNNNNSQKQSINANNNRFSNMKVKHTISSTIQQPTNMKQTSQSSNINFTKTSQKSPSNPTNNLFLAFTPSTIQKPIQKKPQSFSSIREQSSKCLNHLSFLLTQQIISLNNRIDNVNGKIHKILNEEMKKIKQTITKMVDEVFMQSQKTIQAYIKEQENLLYAEVIQSRNKLEIMSNQVQSMKNGIQSSQWRKTAAQLIASDLQAKVLQTVEKSKNIHIKPWQLNQLKKNQKISSFVHSLQQLTNPHHWVR